MKISRGSMEEVERALDRYSKELDDLFAKAIIKENTRHTYRLYANHFVRWLKDEFEPGGRNK